MEDYAKLALLPEGMHDDLPPFAEQEADVIDRLLATFASHGYDRVKPPLMEFEDSLLAGPGGRVARHMFRLMDPISQRMMGLRADMTTQVARIASTRLKHAPRPLRLCYAGQVLRVRGTQLRPERQFAQAGVELIGPELPGADAEVVLLAVDALRGAGVKTLTVDLTVPNLVPLLADGLGLDENAAASVRNALDTRDGAAVAALPATGRAFFARLMDTAGPAGDALAALRKMELPAAAVALVEKLETLVEAVQAAEPGLALTIDPGESRGFEYQTGVSFTLLGKGVRGELGRGGRYALVNGESATGFTLYLDSLMRAVPAPGRRRRVFVPHGTDPKSAEALREEGWRTVGGLEPVADAAAEARRLECSHVLKDGKPQSLA